MAMAENAGSFSEVFSKGKASGFFRLRYENVDQANLSAKAHAFTLKSVLGFKTASYYNLHGYLQFENVSAIGKTRYNLPGAVPSHIDRDGSRPVVADPESSEVNQAYLNYDWSETKIKLGRQQVIFDNSRFVGNVGWRQNEQTFDAVRLSNNTFSNTTLNYVYIDRVNRIFADNVPMSSHIVNASYDFSYARLVGYVLILDYDSVTTADRSTYGASFRGKWGDGIIFNYGVEYANQSDSGDNTLSISADYLELDLGLVYNQFSLKIGYEELGSDGGVTSFATPLATLHKFNGWADRFLTTPAAGLNDTSISVGYKISPRSKIGVTYHSFEADTGGADYGDELDAVIVYNATKKCQIGAKYADYSGDASAPGTLSIDLKKFWLWTQYKF